MEYPSPMSVALIIQMGVLLLYIKEIIMNSEQRKEYQREYQKIYRELTKEKAKLYQNAYREQNSEKIKEYQKTRKKQYFKLNKPKLDPIELKISDNMRS